jgi:hypothetical protein
MDLTKIKVYGGGEWKVRQRGVSKRHTWIKLHLAVDETTGEILAAVISNNDWTDPEILPHFLEQIDADDAFPSHHLSLWNKAVYPHSPLTPMPNPVQYKQTWRFINIWAYLALGSLGIVILAGLASVFFVKPLVSKTVEAKEEEPVRLEPLAIKPQAIGGLRVDVAASIPVNRWLTYEVQLRDQQDKILAAGLKNAWHETGIWQEEGETGTWQEDDLEAGLDVRAAKSEPIIVVVEVLNYVTTSNQDIDEPVTFKINVHQGIIDTRYLWPGFWGGLLMAGLTCLFSGSTGATIINKRIGDSDVGERATLGGANKLVKIVVKVESDETSPPTLNCQLAIRDGNGDQLFNASRVISLRFRRDEEGDITSVKGEATFHIILEQVGSYGFYVEVTPDAPVDATQLIVKQGVVTLGAIKVAHISARA